MLAGPASRGAASEQPGASVLMDSPPFSVSRGARTASVVWSGSTMTRSARARPRARAWARVSRYGLVITSVVPGPAALTAALTVVTGWTRRPRAAGGVATAGAPNAPPPGGLR